MNEPRNSLQAHTNNHIESLQPSPDFALESNDILIIIIGYSSPKETIVLFHC